MVFRFFVSEIGLYSISKDVNFSKICVLGLILIGIISIAKYFLFLLLNTFVSILIELFNQSSSTKLTSSLVKGVNLLLVTCTL